MRLLSILLTFFLFVSCSNSRIKSSSENEETTAACFVIDTLISGHQIKLTMVNPCLINEMNNEFRLEIEGVRNGDVVVYTSISDGIIRVSKRTGYFQITPESTVKKVAITINYMLDGCMNKLGQLELKTCTDLVHVDL